MRSPRLVEVKVKKGTSPAHLAAHMSRMKEVEYAFVPPVRTLFAKRRKSGPDPMASRQWGHGAIRLGHARAKAGFNNASGITRPPLAVELIGFVSGRSFRMAPGAIARVALITVILPLFAGMTVRALLPGVADRLEKVVSLMTKVLLPLAVLVLLVGSWRVMWAAVGDGSIAAIITFVTAGLLAGHLLGGPDPEHAVVLALSSACRHPAIALTIAAANFPGQHFEGTILLYLAINALIGVPYLVWQRQQTAAATAPA